MRINVPTLVDLMQDADENLFDAVISDDQHVLHNLLRVLPPLASGSQ